MKSSEYDNEFRIEHCCKMRCTYVVRGENVIQCVHTLVHTGLPFDHGRPIINYGCVVQVRTLYQLNQIPYSGLF